MNYMLDTNVLIHVIRNRSEKVKERMAKESIEKAGNVIGPHDMLIAAHAKSEGLILVTNNTREFKRIPGLTVEDWTV